MGASAPGGGDVWVDVCCVWGGGGGDVWVDVCVCVSGNEQRMFCRCLQLELK